MMKLNEELLGCHQKLLDYMKNEDNEEAKMLLQSVEDRSSLVDSSGSTLLHYAVGYENVAMVEYLIEMKFNINAVNNSGFTPLMLAVQNADTAIVDILLKNNAHVLTEGYALKLALNCIINSSLVPGRQKYQWILEMLLDKVYESYLSSKDVVIDSIFRCTELDQMAVVVFGNEDLAEDILMCGYYADFKEPTKGFTALHCAIIFAKFENAEWLMKLYANINALDNRGFTPLHYYTCNFEAVDVDSKVLKRFLSDNPGLYTPDQRGVSKADYLMKYGQEKTRGTVIQVGLDMVVNYGSIRFAEMEEMLAKVFAFLLQIGLNAQSINVNSIPLMQHLIHRRNMTPVRLLVQHLALARAIDQNVITERTRNTIESSPELKGIFDLHAQKLESIKNVVMFGTLTLFNILTERQYKLVNYARNQDFILHLNRIIESVPELDSYEYYFNTIRTRVSNALERVSFETKVAPIIQALTGLCADTYHVIVYKIMEYLGLQDFNNLCRAKGTFLVEY